jgi:hypothetical protein
MMVAATAHTVIGIIIARRVAEFFRAWAFCLCVLRTRVQQALALQKHRKTPSTVASSPQPNSTVVMLVESDVRGGSHGILP